MIRLILILYVMLFSTFCYLKFPEAKKAWNLEFISINTTSANEDLIKFNLRVQRVSRGVYGLSGTVDLGDELLQGDNLMLESKVYRSVTGSSEYYPTPMEMKKTHIFKMMNVFYKFALMSSAAKCSNLPVFKDKFEPPFEKKYELNKCEISSEGLAPYIPNGYYKLVTVGSGKWDFNVEIIYKIESNI